MLKKKPIPVNFPVENLLRVGQAPIETDPFGSYTGVPNEQNEAPVQDADDL